MRPLKVFIIQPFNSARTERFRELVVEVCASPEFKGQFEAFHAVDEPSAHFRLQDRINEYIKKADICVADLVGLRSENVLLEVGAAYALRIPVIPFSDKELPADISGNVYINIALEHLDDDKVQSVFRRVLNRKLKEARDDIGKIRTNWYLADAFADRGFIDFFSLIQRCETRLDLLTTNLNYVVNEHLACGEEKQEKTFLEILVEEVPKKQARFQLRILALDPDSNFATERAKSLGRGLRTFREQMREDLNLVKEYIESERCNASAEIRIYDQYPLQMTFFFDDLVISSVVATSRSSRYCITYSHSLKEMGASETYERHFDSVWGSAPIYAASQRKRNSSVRSAEKGTRK